MSFILPIMPPSFEELRPSFMDTEGDEPRLVTAEEVLKERALYKAASIDSTIYSWHVGASTEFFDPTGEETAKYLNMEFSSTYARTTKLPTFGWSRLAMSSYLAHLKPGFYIGNAKKPSVLNDVIMVLSPPLALNPKRILYISPDYVWDEFIRSECRTYWTRYTYIRGQSLWYKPTDYDMNIPNAEFTARLKYLYARPLTNLARYNYTIE